MRPGSLAACIIIFATAGALSTEEGSGILYFVGSGTGGGTMHIYAHEKLLKLRFDNQKTKIQNSASSRYRYGQKCTSPSPGLALFSGADSFNPMEHKDDVIECRFDIFMGAWKKAMHRQMTCMQAENTPPRMICSHH